MLTADQLQSIMPHASPTRRQTFLPFLTSAMTEFAIDTPPRAAAFLAQLAHESGELRFMEELWGPTDAQRRYEPVTELSQKLGNTQPGDGKRFKGRGPIQLTGRANYQRFGELLNVDLTADPPRAALPEVGFRVAGLFWTKKGLNELADLATDAAFKTITVRINGGTNGLSERQAFYAVARAALGVAAAPPAAGRVLRSAPMPAAEPRFARGWEAIRTDVPARRRAARTAPAGRKRKGPATRKKAMRKKATRKKTTRKTARTATRKTAARKKR
jgi:putative chitinase